MRHKGVFGGKEKNASSLMTILRYIYLMVYLLVSWLFNDHSICAGKGRKPDSFKRYDVEKMIAIQFTNGFEINVVDICGRALYPTISRINHSCIPSVTHANVRKNDTFSPTIPNTSNENKYVCWFCPHIISRLFEFL